GDSVTFTGSASDVEDGDLTASIAWTSSIDGAIGSGGSFSTSALSVGVHTITAGVSDSGGLPASDVITVSVNGAPSVAITAPADGTAVNVGASVTFTGTASDVEDGDLTANISWTSSLDGAIGSSGSFSTSALSIGIHTITAGVTDSGGLPASDVITVSVNGAPSVAITAPADGSTVNVGDSVTFTGTASDTEDGDLTANVAWTSSIDGAIGSGGSFSTSALSVGVHSFTAGATAGGGPPASHVAPASVNGAPSVAITAPADGSAVNVGDSVTFTGTASDVEDGDLTASIAWTSSIDGAIGSGGSF
ncbi:MAG: hypothetical protein GY833_17330, partial [Aestuariibacter sp.]|nr:hypothetical protein [Aestuariibacter sp.]